MLKYAIAGGLMAALVAGAASANEFEAELKQLAATTIAEIANDPAIIEAIKAQNVETASYDQAKIDELDQTWRAETEEIDQPMIDAVLERPASLMLADVRESSDGMFTEIFVMDAKGLNVAQSDPTSDYWQGDEAKWQDTFGVSADAIHLSEIEEDESTQTFQSQVSLSIADPDNGAVIGAITVGVNVELIE